MKAVILAAGEGSRLKPFTATGPKVMIPVGNKPILEYVVNALQESGIVDLVMVVGYKREKIMDHFGDGHAWGVNIVYVEQPLQLGTAHALKQTARYVNDHFLVINGDTIIDSSTIKAIMHSKDDGAAILTINVDAAQKYGVVSESDGLVKSIHEKPKGDDIGNTVNAGVYKFSLRIFDFLQYMEISERGDYEITDAIRKMLAENYPIRAVHSNATWMDALYPWDLIKLNEATLKKQRLEIRGKVEPGSNIMGPVHLGNNSVIRSGSYIIGPVSIGDNCEIGPNAVILPSTSIGSNSTVESFTRIYDSILMNNVKVSSFSHIERSVIGEGTTIGPGFVAESGNVKAEIDDRLIGANIGSIIGANTSIAGRVLVDPGCIIGTKCRIGPGNMVRTNVPDGMKVL